MRKRSELIFNFLLVPVDVLMMLIAFVLAFVIRVRIEGRPVVHQIGGMEFIQMLLVVVPVWIFIFAMVGLYRQSETKSQLTEYGRVVVAVSGCVMFMILFDFFRIKPIFPSKAVPIYAYGLSIVFTVFARLIVREVRRWLYRFGVGVDRVLMIGSGEISARVLESVAHKRSGFTVVGIVSAKKKGGEWRGFRTFDSFDEAIAELENNIDVIIQADPNIRSEDELRYVDYAISHSIDYRYTPSQLNMYIANSRLFSLAGVPMVEVRLTPLDGWGRIAKRLFDVFGATVALILLSPAFLIISLVIAATDPGPIFYSHRRLSRAGGKVNVLKFRTMKWKYCTGSNRPYKTAEEALAAMGRPELIKEFQKDQKLADDPRVNKFGRFLRQSSLDEIPQFVNVLLGGMSLVGPRPILPVELDRFGKYGATRMALKPGVTGLWQVSGRNDISYDEKVKLDIYYVENWSLWLDIKICLKTALVIIGRKGY